MSIIEKINKIKLFGSLMLVTSVYLVIFPLWIWFIFFGDVFEDSLYLHDIVSLSFLWLIFWSSLIIKFILVSIRYIKNKPFKQNKLLGNLFIIGSLIYSTYELIVYVIFYNYLYDNGFLTPAGKVGESHMSPSYIFIFCAYVLLLGIALKIFGIVNNNLKNNFINKIN